MSFASNSVIAKARAIYGRTLSLEDYTQLAAKRSVPDAAAFLKQTERYGKALSGIEPQAIHRGQLEALLRRSVFDIFEGFHKFDFSPSRGFFDFIVKRMEIDLVLTAIEGIAAGSEVAYIASLPMFLTRHSSVDLTGLGSAKSYSDIDRILSGTMYGKVLKPLLSEGENVRINIGECERRMCTAYYINCFKVIDANYRGGERTELKTAVLKVIDFQNVVICCRIGAFSGISPDDVKLDLLPFKYRLSDEAIERLVRDKDIDHAVSVLASMGYRTDRRADFGSVERLTQRISFDYLRRLLRMSRSSAVVYFALVECLFAEYKNIRAAVEGIRYGLSSAEILDMLVL